MPFASQPVAVMSPKQPTPVTPPLADDHVAGSARSAAADRIRQSAPRQVIAGPQSDAPLQTGFMSGVMLPSLPR
jgi:hypothetical protein